MGELLNVLLITAVCIVPPVSGPVVASYSPLGQYAGHWGIDYSVSVGTEVTAPVRGRVTFAGSVAGMNSVTIEPVPGFKVSVSFLNSILVQRGEWVSSGDVVGLSGSAHGKPGVHMSTRIDGGYVDPRSQLGCAGTDISRALRLVTPPQPYPRTRANRNSRRDLRPDSSRPSPLRRNGDGFGATRPGPVHARW